MHWPAEEKKSSRDETRNTCQKKGGAYKGAYLACCCLALICLVPERNTLVRESKFRPAQRESVQLLEATALEIMADDGDARWIRACELAEASDGE